jgi:hypothetical protein
MPLGRLAPPADQAAMAIFLAGDGARHIAGTISDRRRAVTIRAGRTNCLRQVAKPPFAGV